MANKTPHIVGGGLGTIRKRETAKAIARAKAEQEANNKAAMSRIIKSLSK